MSRTIGRIACAPQFARVWECGKKASGGAMGKKWVKVQRRATGQGVPAWPLVGTQCCIDIHLFTLVPIEPHCNGFAIQRGPFTSRAQATHRTGPPRVLAETLHLKHHPVHRRTPLPPSLRTPRRRSHTTVNLTTPSPFVANMKKFGNVYLIAAISIIGGGLFGFDISSMSAM